MATHKFGRVVLVIILGAMIGTLFGKLIGLVLPEGVVKEVFLKDAHWAVGPADIDVGLFAITLGFKITLNAIGFLGVCLAIYLLRWYF
jgi:hypothetical protein